MGIQATVVYDAATHAPLVVRSSTSNATTVASLADTIASFAEHVDALTASGGAATPAEVCALWGGPPYITYVVVRRRFRVVVVWSEEPGELDVCYDVHCCLSTLQRAVARNASGLVDDAPETLAAVYDAAGHALLGGDDDLADEESVASDALLGLGADGEPQKKGLRKLFNRSMRLVEGKPAQKRAFRRNKTQPANLVHVPDEAPQVLDVQAARLTLPNEVFNWADFGGPLAQGGGDVSWLAELMQGDHRRTAIATPLIRDEADAAASARQSDAGSVGPRPGAMSPIPVLPPAVGTATTPSAHASSVVSPSNSSLPSQAPGAAPPQSSASATPVSAASPAPAAPRPAAAPSSVASPAVVVAPPVPTPVSNAPTSGRSAVLPAAAPVASPAAPQPVPQATATPHASYVQPAVAAAAPRVAPPNPQPAVPMQAQATMPMQAQRTMPAAARGGVPQGVGVPPAPPSGFRGRGDAGDDFDIAALGTLKGGAGAPKAASAPSADPIRGMMNDFAKTMQAGNFPAALQQVYATLQTLSTQPLRQKETNTCANYVLALKIMQRVRTANAADAALLAMFMAELKHLLPTHRTAAMRMAIDKNLAVGNFGMAARWMRQVPNGNYAAKLQLCVQRGEVNAHMPATNKLCYQTLAVLTPPYAKCNRCPAVYNVPQLSGVQVGQSCPTCFAGFVVVAQR